MRATELESVEVHWNGVLAGRLSRIPAGSRFDYEESFLRSSPKPPRGIATRLPYADAPFVTHGVNLHPFFAGLLPEGLRLQAIIASARTSPDDLFSLLIEAGPDCVGDVYAAAGADRADVVSLDLGTELDFSEAKRRYLEGARDAAIPGVQPKLSAAVLSMPIRRSSRRPASILKLSPSGYPLLVENEAFFMGLAKRCGLRVPKTELIRDVHGEAGLLVERFDRLPPPKGESRIGRVHQEDACQFLDKYPSEKYRVSMREVAEAIASITDAPKVQLIRLLELYVFSYLIGNADLHAKNISIYRNPATGLMELSPAYDLVCTLAYPQLDPGMALALEGKTTNFIADEFVKFFGRLDVPGPAVRNTMSRMIQQLSPWVGGLEELGYEPTVNRKVLAEIDRRTRRLAS